MGDVGQGADWREMVHHDFRVCDKFEMALGQQIELGLNAIRSSQAPAQQAHAGPDKLHRGLEGEAENRLEVGRFGTAEGQMERVPAGVGHRPANEVVVRLVVLARMAPPPRQLM